MQRLNLLGLAAGGLLIGMGVTRSKIDASPSFLTSAVIAFGILDILTNEAVVAHALDLI